MAQVISITSLKRQVGKTSTTILLANCLGMSGKKILVIDLDISSSLTNYYLKKDTEYLIGERNAAYAMLKVTNDLSEYIVPTRHEGVDLVASSLYLVDLRTVEEKRQSKILKGVKEIYDYIIIDCPASYCALALNAYSASNFIIIVAKVTEDYQTTTFLTGKIRCETNKGNNLYLHLNFYYPQFSNAKGGKQKECLTVFKSEFKNFTPVTSWFPATQDVRSAIDRKLIISNNYYKKKNRIFSPLLFNAVCAFADCFLEENENLQIGDGF